VVQSLVTGQQIKDDSVQRIDLDTTTAGQAVITKLIAGAGVGILSSTGVDSGTGDVTLTAFGTGVGVIGTINGQPKSSDGLVINSSLYAQSADASFPGLVSTGTQTFAGLKTFSTGIKLSNAVWLVARNIANSADINLLRVDNSDHTILNSASSKNIKFSPSGTASWELAGANLLFDNVTPAILANGFTTGNLLINGGSTGSIASGSLIQLFGSTHGSAPDRLTLDTGSSTSTAKLQLRNQSTLGPIEFNTGSGLLRWSIDSSGNITQDGTNGGNIVFNKTTGQINQGTVDGTDNGSLFLCAGGAAASSRGAHILLYGNENGGLGGVAINAGESGDASLQAGSLSTAAVTLAAPATNGTIKFTCQSLLRWSFSNTGHFTQDSTNGGDLVFNISAPLIRTGTSDAADNSFVELNGGGGSGNTRGARIITYGNEHVNTGKLLLAAGNVAGGTVQLETGGITHQEISNSQVQTTYNSINSVETNASVQTTDATQTNLFTLTLADNTTYTFDVNLNGRRSSTTAMGVGGKLRFTVYRNNAGVAIIASDFGGAIKELDFYGSSGYDFTVDVSSNDVRIRVTGAASQTVNWAANMRYLIVS
jgi:hypothetical protein